MMNWKTLSSLSLIGFAGLLSLPLLSAENDILAPDNQSFHVKSSNTSLSFSNVPLTEALASIADVMNVEILLDQPAMTKANVDLQAPVSFSGRTVDLDKALKKLLAPSKLTFTRKGKTVVVSTEVVDLKKLDGDLTSKPRFVSVRQQAMQSLLKRKVPFGISHVPLHVALQFAETLMDGQRIRVDRTAIRKAGISMKQIVELPVETRTVHDHLTKLLEQAGLTYRVKKKGVLVTVPDAKSTTAK